jgi:flavin reductase (DIM6/NTAB) family NADH-FMN oxidoreductase RutF
MMSGDTFPPDDVEGRALRSALGRFATGVTLVTTATEAGPLGFTANSFASVSLDPPLVLWSPARSSSRFPAFAAARFYTIHVLGAEQFALIGRFARGGVGFEGLPALRSPEGAPLIADPLARFDCEQHATHDGGDHLIIVGRVLRAAFRDGDPLVFSQGRYGGVSPS